MLCTIFTKNGEVHAVSSKELGDDETLRVFIGKYSDKKYKTLNLPNSSYEKYCDELVSLNYQAVGEGSFTLSGKVINFDLFDTLTWSCKPDLDVQEFKNQLKNFEKLFTQATNQTLSVNTQTPITYVISFNDTTKFGIDLKAEFNVVSQYGDGVGKVTRVQCWESVFLVLYLHSFGLINISSEDIEIDTRKSYPQWVHTLLDAHKELKKVLGLECVFDQIQPMTFNF